MLMAFYRAYAKCILFQSQNVRHKKIGGKHSSSSFTVPPDHFSLEHGYIISLLLLVSNSYHERQTSSIDFYACAAGEYGCR